MPKRGPFSSDDQPAKRRKQEGDGDPSSSSRSAPPSRDLVRQGTQGDARPPAPGFLGNIRKMSEQVLSGQAGPSSSTGETASRDTQISSRKMELSTWTVLEESSLKPSPKPELPSINVMDERIDEKSGWTFLPEPSSESPPEPELPPTNVTAKPIKRTDYGSKDTLWSPPTDESKDKRRDHQDVPPGPSNPQSYGMLTSEHRGLPQTNIDRIVEIDDLLNQGKLYKFDPKSDSDKGGATADTKLSSNSEEESLEINMLTDASHPTTTPSGTESTRRDMQKYFNDQTDLSVKRFMEIVQKVANNEGNVDDHHNDLKTLGASAAWNKKRFLNAIIAYKDKGLPFDRIEKLSIELLQNGGSFATQDHKLSETEGELLLMVKSVIMSKLRKLPMESTPEKFEGRYNIAINKAKEAYTRS